MANLDGFLDSIKERLNAPPSSIVIVTGNDSADLDSIISALTFSFISTLKSPDTLYVPLVKVPVPDLELRPELNYVFKTAGVDYKKLICIDCVDLQALYNAGARVILVDHNRLTPPFDENIWAERVIGVLDHHKDEAQYKDAPLRKITTIGSCISLVVLDFPDSFQQDKRLAELASAPILVDTIGLKWEYGKTTEADVKAYDIVKKFTSFTCEKLEEVKSRVDHLCTRDLLRKDYKEFFVNGYRVGTSSLPWNLESWIERDGVSSIIKETQAYVAERSLNMEIILTSYNDDQGNYKRELALFVPHGDLLPIKTTLEEDSHVGLEPLHVIHTQTNSGIGFYHQGNVKLSRKQIWPMVESQIEKIPQ
ncbi:hypothetical protein BJV82DRAFT_513427 [Fennellomyces sp. T-0311]|nr:hypothetical protein BJV82DRAFT_513427 [Fennellomyces sp. T-0311]